MENGFQIIIRAEQLIELRKFKDAISELEKVTPEMPFFGLALNMQFDCYLELKDYKKAKSIVDFSLERDPNNAETHMHLCMYHVEKNELKKAINANKRAIQLEPDNTHYLCQLVLNYINANYKIQAKATFKRIEQIDPASPFVILARANIHIMEHDMKKALAEIERGLEIDPTNEVLLDLRVSVLKDNPQNIKLAEESAIHALTLDPHNEQARQNLLQVLKSKNGFLRFFIGNSFNRYEMEWTAGRIIMMIFFWKGVLIWGGLGILYLSITWYLGVLYNSLIRLHKKYKLLLTSNDIMQSNVFLFMNAFILLFVLASSIFNLTTEEFVAITIGYTCMLFIGISFFEINYAKGKKQFYVFTILSLALLCTLSAVPIAFSILSVFLILVYAFLFTLNIGFR